MIIYLVTNIINSKKYVGQTVHTADVRLSQHIYSAIKKNTNCVLHKSIRKHGKENFTIEILDTATNIEELNKKEVEWISNLNTHYISGDGYNMNFGGGSNFGYKASQETKDKISKAGKGKIHSQETRDLMSKIMTGRKVTWGDKVSEGVKKSYKENPEYLATAIAAFKKASDLNRRQIEILKDGQWIIFDSIKECAESINAKAPNITNVLNGKKDTIKGFIVRYVDLELRAKAEEIKKERKNKKFAHKRVKCVETQQVFASIKEAALIFKVTSTAVWCSISKGSYCNTVEFGKKHFINI